MMKMTMFYKIHRLHKLSVRKTELKLDKEKANEC